MRRLLSILVVLALVVFSHAAGGTTVADERPNVVWIFWDADELDEGDGTPVLNRLLAGARRFTCAHVPVPSGRPHRTALLAGAWPRETGVCYRSGAQRGRLESTVLGPLSAAGYRSFQYGAFFRRLPEGGSFDAQAAGDDAPRELAAFLERDPAKPLFACFTAEPPSAREGGPGDEAGRRRWLDAALGGFLEALGEHATARETVFFVLADPTGDATELDPDEVYERLRARTLAVVGPGITAGEDATVVSTLSLHGTLVGDAGLAGVEPLAPSLRAALDSGEAPTPATVFGELYHGQTSGRGGANLAREVVALYARTERFKYVLFLKDLGVDHTRGSETATIAHDRGTELLFDLESDPNETTDLAESLEHTGRVESLREATVGWWNAKARGELPVPYFSPPLGPAPEDDRPNIVLVVSDDQDYEHLGFLGNQLVATPALDRLAAEGVVFPVAHVTMSRCRPSLASLLCGRLPHETAIYDNKAARKLDAEGSLPNRLKEAGYATFVGGKYWEGRTRAMGFMEPERLDVRFRHFVRESQGQLFDFVDRYKDERPFFVWWAPMLPHSPFDPPERLAKRFEGTEVPIPEGLQGDAAEYAALERTAFAMEAWFDEGLGALIEKLKAAGEYENTLFCFLIDNGWANGLASKGTVFEKGLRTPVFFTWPAGIEGGRTDPALVSSVDLYATLLDYARVTPTPGVTSRSLRPLIEGGDAAGVARDALYGVGYRYNDRRRRTTPAKDAFAIYARDARYKLVVYLQDVLDAERFDFIHACAPFPARRRGDRDLYDLESDPYERRDLADDPRYAAEIERLLAGWREWWREVEGPALNVP